MDELPSEILCMIFKNLDYLDIFTCGLCCRRFYDIAKHIDPFKKAYKFRKTIIKYAIKCNDVALFEENLSDADLAFYDKKDFYNGVNEKAIKKHLLYYFKYDRVHLFHIILQTYVKSIFLYSTDIIINCIETNNIKFYKVLLNMPNDHIFNFRMYYARFIIQIKNKTILEFSIKYLNRSHPIKCIMESLIIDTTPLILDSYGKLEHVESIHIKDAIIKYIDNDYYEELCKKLNYNA